MPEKQKSPAHVDEQRGGHRQVRRVSPLSFRSATYARLANRHADKLLLSLLPRAKRLLEQGRRQQASASRCGAALC